MSEGTLGAGSDVMRRAVGRTGVGNDARDELVKAVVGVGAHWRLNHPPRA